VPLEHEALTERIVGAAIEVHKVLGPGFLESIYVSALAVELRAREIPFERKDVLSATAQVSLSWFPGFLSGFSPASSGETGASAVSRE
jgi:hypothetical protein